MPYEPFMITYILKMCWGTRCSKSELSFASIWDGCNGSTGVLFKEIGVCLYRIRDNLYKLPKITEEIFCFRYYFRWYWIHIEDNLLRIGKFHLQNCCVSLVSLHETWWVCKWKYQADCLITLICALQRICQIDNSLGFRVFYVHF